MKTTTRNILTGFGSVLDIMPDRPRRAPGKPVTMTPEQITTKAWEMVGESFRMAIGQVSRESRADHSND